LRRWTIYRPLAVAMALLLMMPALSWFGRGSAVSGWNGPLQASAQSTLCNPSPSNAVIQTVCPPTSYIYPSDLYQLESDAVNAYLAMHNLPSTDASVIYTYGRSDLRSAIRAQMVTIMLGVIATPAASRTTHQQHLYNWLQALVQGNEIKLYTNALSQFNSFESNPCGFTLNPTVAAQYNLSYQGAPFCFASLSSLFGGPTVPAPSYFTAYGLYTSYEAPAQTYSYFSNITANTGVHVGEVAGIATAIGGVLLATAGSALIASLSASLTAFLTTTATSGLASIAAASLSATFVVSGSTVGSLGIGALTAGPAAIVGIAIAIGVAAGMQLFTNESNLNALSTLSSTLTQVTNTPPDLSSFANDTSGLGMFKIQTTIDAQTLPEIPSTAALPAHINGTDLNFTIATSGSSAIGSTLNYKDWSGNTWSAETSGGWFVQTCTDATQSNCPQKDSMIASIEYVDWSGVNWTASREGYNFVSTKASPASSDTACTGDAVTGLTPVGTNVSGCSSYSSSSIPVTDNNGNQITVSFTQLSSAQISSPTTLVFSPGTASSQTVTFTGYPTPTVCYSSGTVTPDFSLNGGGCGSGSFTISFNGDINAANPVVYPLTLSASNSQGTVQQVVNINVSLQLNIISPSSLTARAATPVNFTVVATGVPPPALSLYNLTLPSGLNFTDNGNGTATISGSTPIPLSSGICLQSVCGIEATNTQGTIYQGFTFNITSAPLASLVPPDSATFVVGASNSVLLTATGQSTPVSWSLGPFQQPIPSWLSLRDNGNGTAYLKGTPPEGTTGSFEFYVVPAAQGTFAQGDPYIINFSNAPLFTNANTIDFTVGQAGEFTLTPTTGTTTLVGTLPSQVSFLNNEISGTPATGTGGQYTLTANDNAGVNGSTSQTLTLNVYEAPAFTSAASATCFTGVACTIQVTTTGYPIVSTSPVPTAGYLPTNPSEGYGMKLQAFGLLNGFQASNLNAEGFATGTLNITGTPSSQEAGTSNLLIQATNGVGGFTNQNFSLKILAASPTPAGAILATASGLSYSRVTQTFNGTVTFKNVGNSTINGPLLVVFSGLQENVSLVDQSGLLNNVPYLSVAVTSLAPGQSGSASVQFKNPSSVIINFTPVIYSGASN
jgi:hypothetical protein